MSTALELRVGLIGLGRMGRAMAERLIEQAVPLTVWNRDPARARGLPEGSIVASPAAVAEHSDIILIVVRDAAALDDVYASLLTTSLAGKTVVEMSTASIGAVTSALARAADAGATVLDAPISGSVCPARRGELLIMAGGETSTFERARPVFDRLARRAVHTGALGSGIAMKLVVNLPLAAYWQSLGEAIGLGIRHGLAADQVLAVIADSKAAIGALTGKIDRILDPSLPAEFDVAGVLKDLEAMRDSAAAVQFDVPACTTARDAAQAAVGAGFGNSDLALLVRLAAGLSAAPGASS
jgi:3-hydroxyisobutyrate dehydrogenase